MWRYTVGTAASDAHTPEELNLGPADAHVLQGMKWGTRALSVLHAFHTL